jgi:hypothetical protein
VFNELQRDANVQKLLNQHQKELVLLHDRTLFPFASIRNQSNLPTKFLAHLKKHATNVYNMLYLNAIHAQYSTTD